MELDKDININIEEEFMQYIEVLKDSMSGYRWQHSMGVAEAAKKLAVFWGADPKKAWLAGIFHDYARELPEDQLIKLALENGLSILREEKDNPIVLHAPVGAILVNKEFGILDPEILSAISKHTVGGEPLTLLEKIVFLADMIEEGREWTGVDKLRIMVYQDIDQTLKEALEGTIKFLQEKGQDIHPNTLVTYKKLKDGHKDNIKFETNMEDGKGERILTLTSHDLSMICASAAEKKRGGNIVIMDLQGISIIADYFVICTGGNSNQVKAICDHINENIVLEGLKPALRIEGLKDARWVLMDFGSVVVHIFQEEERLYYNLERLWGDAKFTYYVEQEG